MNRNQKTRLRKFIAIRGLYQQFNLLPEKVETNFVYRYTNITGILASASIFKQDYFRTNFIYGFGRTEDVPEGFSIALTGGYSAKKNEG